ncbi:MAG: hypothetical protein EPN36_08500 [Rhodanobacteraceae bacterium]|nr:MAG: hypothetical protein EPN36_08500 [Rhodanobacteraceae bacterium]
MNNDLLLPYLNEKFPLTRSSPKQFRELHEAAEKLAAAKSEPHVIAASLALSQTLDGSLEFWRAQFKGDSGYSYLRGTVLEAITIQLAMVVAGSGGSKHDLTVEKISTGTGVITGLSFQFRRDSIPKDVPLTLRRDRDDVIIGIKRTIVVTGTDGSRASFEDELIPICVVACKMYIDATRLENVLAKARSILASHSRCSFLVASDWDALGEKEWHDAARRLLDSLYAPVEDIIFLRGDGARRPKNSDLAKKSLSSPYLSTQLQRLAHAMRAAIKKWN